MAALTFTQSGNGYVATAEVNADFAIHVECSTESRFEVQATVLNGGVSNNIGSGLGDSFEGQWTSKIFPLYVTVFSSVNPIANKSIIKEAE